MRGKLMFAAGVGLGYLLGTRAGRERFDQITEKARQFWQSDTVQEAAGAVQAKAGRLYDTGKQMVTEQTQRMRQKSENRRHPSIESPERQETADEAAWEAPVGFPVNTSY
jgi:hypothetical protein